MSPTLHEAMFRFSTENAPKIYEALIPELSDEVNPRSAARCELIGNNLLVLSVTAEDISALRAALNMYLRLISVADEMQNLV
jgi:KEOPS complex subunit Pcc1